MRISDWSSDVCSSDLNRVNRRIVLASHPRGMPTPDNFRLEDAGMPVPSDGQVLLHTLYLSLDPYMRNLMNEIGPVYAPSIPLGSTMAGGTVSRVVDSGHPRFQVVDLVIANAGWQDYAVSSVSDLMLLAARARPYHARSGLGISPFPPSSVLLT